VSQFHYGSFCRRDLSAKVSSVNCLSYYLLYSNSYLRANSMAMLSLIGCLCCFCVTHWLSMLNRLRLSLAGTAAQLSLIGVLCCSAVSHWLLPLEQRKTHGYNNVEIRDFSASWQSGLGMEFQPHTLPIVQFKNLAVFRNRFRWIRIQAD
jgi:hypothetical protein